MIRSMTAFARVQEAGELATLIWEVKTVNHRYLEVSPRLPDAFRELDSPLRERCRQRLGRGKVDVTLRYQLREGDQGLSLNEALVKELADAVRQGTRVVFANQAGGAS